MTAVELGGDVDRQAQLPERLGGADGVGGRREEVAAQADEDVNLTIVHGGDTVDHIVAGLARHGEVELLLHGVEEGPGRPLPHAHGAIALNVGVATHAAGARPGPPDVPAQQQHVHQRANG